MTGLRWAGVVVAIGLAAAAIAAYTAFGAFLPWREEAEAERLAQVAGVRVHGGPDGTRHLDGGHLDDRDRRTSRLRGRLSRARRRRRPIRAAEHADHDCHALDATAPGGVAVRQARRRGVHVDSLSPGWG